MGRYLLHRLMQIPLTVLGVVTVVFFIIHLVPGDPVVLYLGDHATADAIVNLRHQLGFDRPILMQYVDYMYRMLTGHMGQSLRTQQAVMHQILASFPYTLELAVASVLCSVLIGLPVGILSAVRRNTVLDYGVMGLAMIGVSMPVFLLAMLLIIGLALKAHLFPILGVGLEGDIGDRLMHLVLPALTIGLTMAALVARITRSNILDVLGQDFVRTARAKGLSERVVVYKHVLRNAMIPLITVVGLNMGNLLGGALITESVFSRPGLGRLILESISARDYPQIQGTVAFFAMFFVVVNLFTDLTYVWVDPRIRYD